MILKTPLENWIERNKFDDGFGESLAKLLGFACAEWIRRTRGFVFSREKALSLFLMSNLYDIGKWITNPESYSHEIADFCEKTKTLALPDELPVDFLKYLDLRGVLCPSNAVRSRLVLSSLPDGFHIKIALDDGAPIENVPQALVADGHNVVFREKKGSFWEIEVVKRISML